MSLYKNKDNKIGDTTRPCIKIFFHNQTEENLNTFKAVPMRDYIKQVQFEKLKKQVTEN